MSINGWEELGSPEDYVIPENAKPKKLVRLVDVYKLSKTNRIVSIVTLVITLIILGTLLFQSAISTGSNSASTLGTGTGASATKAATTTSVTQMTADFSTVSEYANITVGEYNNVTIASKSTSAPSNTIDVYIDMVCPYCQQFMVSAAWPALVEKAANGKIVLTLHIVDVHGGLGETAGNAVLTVAKYSAPEFLEFIKTVFNNFSTQVTNEQLVNHASSEGVSEPVTTMFAQGIFKNNFEPSLAKASKDVGFTGTPSIYLNGSKITSQSQLENL
jgi:protein-disulfide isomerase